MPKFEACALNFQLIDIYLLNYVTPKLPENFMKFHQIEKFPMLWCGSIDLLWYFQSTLFSKLFMTASWQNFPQIFNEGIRIFKPERVFCFQKNIKYEVKSGKLFY